MIGHNSFGLVLRLALFVVCVTGPFSSLEARSVPSSTLGPDYAHALATADRFLQAWQVADVEGGMVLISNDAKNKLTSDALEEYFSQTGLAYEISHGKQLSTGRYDFPVVLVTNVVDEKHVHRRFSSITVVRTGHNDWTVDKLP